MHDIIQDSWGKVELFQEAFQEYRLVVKEIYLRAKKILSFHSKHPHFKLKVLPLPEELFSLRRNLFSTLFQSVYYLLDIPKSRRLLYAKLNHLFRIWVTSADNLLDREDKIVIPLFMKGNSLVMRQVISIMAADRVLAEILYESKNILTYQQTKTIWHKTLQVLIPSAIEEASEEGGIYFRPHPDYVLYTIHRLKTGLLFHVPFLGPDYIEKNISPKKLKLIKKGLDSFGLGCQLLDDIRDISRDYLEKRHNYCLSIIFYFKHQDKIKRLKILENKITTDTKIFSYFPQEVLQAKTKAEKLLNDGLICLRKSGLKITDEQINKIVHSLFIVLDLKELIYARY